MKRRQFSLRGYIIALFLLACLMCVALPVWAAYQVRRPADYEGGKVNQNYLYGEQLPGYAAHRGLDFKAPLDTAIYAVAAGQVTDLKEDIRDGAGSGFGNFVLIRHTWRSWDRTRSAMSYVYTLYAHLSENGVLVPIGANVTQGQQVAEADDTGTSDGNHLHFQLCLSGMGIRSAQKPPSHCRGTACGSSGRAPQIPITPASTTTPGPTGGMG